MPGLMRNSLSASFRTAKKTVSNSFSRMSIALPSDMNVTLTEPRELSPYYGGSWLRQLHYYKYDLYEKPANTTPSTYSQSGLMAINIPTLAKVFCMTLYKVDLDDCPAFVGALSHHFVVLEMLDGSFCSFEKGKTCILMQSLPATLNPTHQLKKLRSGEKRKKWRTIREMNTWYGCDFTVGDVIEWIYKDKELDDKYHIQLSNCQHFAHRLWRRFEPRSKGGKSLRYDLRLIDVP